MIYFDHNATTPVDERVWEAMLPYQTSFYGNPSSLYRLGRLARSAIDTAREQVAALVDVQPLQVIFTSGGTEANNLAVHNIPRHASAAISSIEHPSVVEPVFARQGEFQQLNLIDVDACGLVQPSAISRLKLKSNDFVSIMLANNETGVIQDIAGLAGRLNWDSVIFHTDAVQALGKIPVSFPALGVSLMSLSAHKIYGPKGCGALVVAKDFTLKPQLRGGGHEQGVRAGTENVAAIVGFGKAAELAKKELSERRQTCLALRNQLERFLSELPGLRIFSREADRLDNTLQFSIEGFDGEMLLMQLDKHQFAVSSGSACASGGGRASPVLTAMGVDNETAKGAIRISLGKDNTVAQINEFMAVFKGLVTS